MPAAGRVQAPAGALPRAQLLLPPALLGLLARPTLLDHPARPTSLAHWPPPGPPPGPLSFFAPIRLSLGAPRPCAPSAAAPLCPLLSPLPDRTLP